MTHSTTDELTTALAADLDRAFPDLVGLLQDDLYSGALRMTGNRADAQDIAQETFVRAYRALVEYSPERIRSLQVYGWMWTIALNLCRNRARGRSRKPEQGFPEGFDPSSTAAGPEQVALATEAGERLGAQVAELPWAQRQAVVLRHVVGLGYTEIGEVLGRPAGTVKADVHRGLAKLREVVSPEEAR
ncbi:MAG: sigma-70 family RNA polymerase sigma factor [Acidimicrobiia bacterium]|nr:sigma-70 family RNA polymerase sigma factor [Acidimicrobiia bacterium]